ncbi:MAG: sulfurtransferase [Bryobacteraceae bacterium]
MNRYCLLTALLASSALLPPLEAAHGGAMLVSTKWLAAHLSDPNVVVLYVGRNRADFDAGFIPKACFVPWDQLVTSRGGIPNELPPASQLRDLFEGCGVSDSSRVVLYGDLLNLSAARAWFTLDYLGHGGHAALLDGGLSKWKAEGRLLATAAAAPRRGHLTPQPRPEVVVTLEAMRDLSWAAVNVAGSRLLLIDSRSPAEFEKEAAHIPGAVNAYWLDDLLGKANPAFRPRSELRKRYQALGARPGTTIVVYCYSGVQASQSYFALKYLGYDVRLYDGSFSEWSRSKDTPAAGR